MGPVGINLPESLLKGRRLDVCLNFSFATDKLVFFSFQGIPDAYIKIIYYFQINESIKLDCFEAYRNKPVEQKNNFSRMIWKNLFRLYNSIKKA